MRTACGHPCSTVAQLALPVALPYSSPSHGCFRDLMPHHSCYSCASSGRGPGSGRGHQPRSSGRPSFSSRGRGPFLSRTQGSSAPPGEGRAPAAGTNHAPPGDRQATAVDDGPFLSRTQGSSANPDGGSNTGIMPLDPSQQWPQVTTLSS